MAMPFVFWSFYFSIIHQIFNMNCTYQFIYSKALPEVDLRFEPLFYYYLSIFFTAPSLTCASIFPT